MLETAQGSTTVAGMTVEEALSFFENEVLPLSQMIPPPDEGGEEVLERLKKLETSDKYLKISQFDLISAELAEKAKIARDILVKVEMDEGELVRWGVIDQWDKDIPTFLERNTISREEQLYVVWVSRKKTDEFTKIWDDKPDGYLFREPKLL